MIIRRKMLNMMMESGEQPSEQYDEYVQEDDYASDYDEEYEEYSQEEEYEIEDELEKDKNGEQVEEYSEDYPNDTVESQTDQTSENHDESESNVNIEQSSNQEEQVLSPEGNTEYLETDSESGQESSEQGLDQASEQPVEQSEVPQSDLPVEQSVEEAAVPPVEPPVKKKPKPKKRRKPVPPPKPKEEEINLFDLDNIDFSQRQERRRGDRRRGFRRLDDRNLVSRAREEADAIRQSALNEGYQSGLEQAAADIEELKNALSAYINAPQEVYEQIAPYILSISVESAKKIINKEIEQDSQVLFNTVVEVLKTLSKEEAKVTLRVNPAEVNELKQHISELIEIAGIDTKVVVLADETVGEGGCLVTTTNGIVDATIDSKISVVTQALKEL